MGLCNSSPWDVFNPGWQACCQCLIIFSGECVRNNIVLLGNSAYFMLACSGPLACKWAPCCWTRLLLNFLASSSLLITLPQRWGGEMVSYLVVNWRNNDHRVLHPLRTLLLCYVGSCLNYRSSSTSEYANILMTEEMKSTWVTEVLIQYVRLNEKWINFKWFADIQKDHWLHITCSVK